MARYFIDTEFVEDGKTIDLISIGIVCSDGREYYAINRDCDFSKASDWVKDNVLIHLPPRPESLEWVENTSHHAKQGWRNKSWIADEITGFVLRGYDPSKPRTENFWDLDNPLDKDPEFWADYAAYDWVALCQTFGTMMDLPKGFPMYCNDTQQEARRLGNPTLPEQIGIKHHALYDAR